VLASDASVIEPVITKGTHARVLFCCACCSAKNPVTPANTCHLSLPDAEVGNAEFAGKARNKLIL